MIFRREPAAILGAIQTVLALVVAFGINLSGEQVGAILAVVAAVFAAITRDRVTPEVEKPLVRLRRVK